MITTVEAYYTASSSFEVSVDLEKVYNWWIKWDTLYIQEVEDGPVEEFEPEYSNIEDLDIKRPHDVEATREDDHEVEVNEAMFW